MVTWLRRYMVTTFPKGNPNSFLATLGFATESRWDSHPADSAQLPLLPHARKMSKLQFPLTRGEGEGRARFGETHRGGNSSGPFPLTPALSLGERGKHRPVLRGGEAFLF